MIRDERIFLAALTRANQEIGGYVVRMMHVSTGSGITEYTRPLADLEQSLGTTLLLLGEQLIDRAKDRGVTVIDAEPHQASDSGMPWEVDAPCPREVPT